MQTRDKRSPVEKQIDDLKGDLSILRKLDDELTATGAVGKIHHETIYDFRWCIVSMQNRLKELEGVK